MLVKCLTWAMLLVAAAAGVHSLPLKEFGVHPACLSESCPNTALLSQPGSQTPERDSRNALEAWLFFLDADFPELVQVLEDTSSAKLHSPNSSIALQFHPFSSFFFRSPIATDKLCTWGTDQFSESL